MSNTNITTPSKVRIVAYWVSTGLVAAVLVLGGVFDLLQAESVRAVMAQLGYPSFLLIILGLWKIPGGVVLLVPRTPRLKEWAYAGAIFNFTGAFASHLAVGHGAAALAWPLAFAGLTFVSWALRPSVREREGEREGKAGLTPASGVGVTA